MDNTVFIIIHCNNEVLLEHILLSFENLNNHFRNISLGITNDIVEAIHYQSVTKSIFIDISSDFEDKNFFNNKIKTYGRFQNIIANCIPTHFHDNIGNLSYFAFQRQLVPYDTYICINTNITPSYSLGSINEDIFDCEPTLRKTNDLFIDLNCLKSGETLDQVQNLPIGISIDQLCQLIRFTSSSENLQNIYFNQTNFNSIHKSNIFSTVIWYLCEGIDEIYTLKQLPPSYTEYIIELKSSRSTLYFRVNNITEQWEVRSNESDKYEPCTRKDYDDALDGKEDF
ncbi:MAG TPA: hypothetical protein PKD85_05425, partial [Saprospiraceae bacterium]|nr:hypothetical protein [Saprospiraceae bacterium]